MEMKKLDYKRGNLGFKMKNLGFILVLLILLSSCARQSTEENLVGNKIVPLPSTMEINNISDATVSAAFEEKDFELTPTGEYRLSLTIYDYELFDLVDISTMAVGDTIVVSQKEIKVETLEKPQSGLIIINGGIENGCVELYTNEDTVYFESGMDGVKSFYKVGIASFAISNDFKFIDDSDLEQQNQVFTYDAFLEKIQNGEIVCNQFNTTVLIVGGEIVEVRLGFIP